jgi:very-long-chain enoyl-CoA reductase
LSIHRQALKLEVKGRTLKDTDTIESLDLRNGSKVYLRDLGPQIGWSTVFLAEYAGPLVVYLWVYTRPWIFYGDVTSAPMSRTAQ